MKTYTIYYTDYFTVEAETEDEAIYKFQKEYPSSQFDDIEDVTEEMKKLSKK